MEFCVMLDVPVPYGHVFRISNEKLGITVREVIDVFVAKVKATDYPDFDLGKHSLYVCDQSDPFNPMQPYEIKDWNIKISDIGHDVFDLFLTMQPQVGVVPCEASAKGGHGVNEFEEILMEAWRKIEIRDYRTAFMILEQAKKLDPSDPRPHRLVAKAAIRMGRMTDNMSMIGNSVQLFPMDRQLKILHGIAEYKRGNYKTALTILREARTYGNCYQRELDEIELYTAKCYYGLRHFKEAQKIVRHLCEIQRPTPGAAKLSAKIMLLRGDVVGSIKTMVARSDYASDFRFFWKYVGHDLASPSALKLFTAECSDWMKRANFPFYMAQALWCYGNMKYAEPYYRRAFALKPDSPSVALGFVRYLVHIGADIEDIIATINRFLAASEREVSVLLGSRCESVSHLIGKDLVQSYSPEIEPFQPLPFKLFEFEQGPLYGNSELDMIAVLIELQIVLFMRGYLSASHKISTVLFDKIQPYSLNMSIIRAEAELCLMIHSFCATIPRPLPATRKFIYAFGSRAVIPLAYKLLTIHGEQTMIQPIVIPGFKFLSFEKPSSEQAIFDHHLSRLPKGSRIILCSGDEDYGVIVDNLRCLLKYDLAQRVVDYPFKALAKKIPTLGNYDVLIHPILPVVAKQNISDYIAFNTRMEFVLKSELKDTCKHMTVLNFHTQLLEDATSQIKPTFLTDNVWNDNYVRALETNLNSLPAPEPRNPEFMFC